MLHEILKKHAGELGYENDPDFPKSARWLWRKIKVVKANLQAMDFDIEYLDKVRPREILIRNNKNVPKDNVNDVNNVGQP